MPDQVLERFHRALIEEIQTQRPEYLTQPFTVAEIYQSLVPYGSHRDRIGVEMNGDYEDALMRLLAGEGGYLILDSEPALKNLRAELDAPNPDSGVYRQFAAVDVRLNQAYLDLSAEAVEQLPDLVHELEAEDPVTLTDLAPSEGNASAQELGVVPPGVDIFADAGGPAEADGQDGAVGGAEAGGVETAASGEAAEAASGDSEVPGDSEAPADAEASDADAEEHVSGTAVDDDAIDAYEEESGASEEAVETKRSRPPLEPEYVETGNEAADGGGVVGRSCVWCRADFPDREKLNYCPFCGTDVRFVPCVSCGEEIEPGWRFCVACGTEVQG